jgi:A/G-specific adenine glycosylase
MASRVVTWWGLLWTLTVTVELQSIAELLVGWFGQSARDLPWRANPDPYQVWVSEVMLQQTRVATVIPYYHRFLARFASVEALAAADVGDVLQVWSGLGYYRRARTLHRAAQSLAPSYELPRTVSGLLGIPGIGRYTAGAIASMAYGLDTPVVDGNVMRVICRIFGIEGDPYRGAVNAQIWSMAEGMIPRGRASEFNQALMELGALVCVPRGPRCGSCPVSAKCVARGLGIAEELPQLRRRTARKRLHLTLLVVRRGDAEVLVRRRPDEGLFGGMWELPSREVAPDDAAEAVASALTRELGITSPPTHVYPPIVRQLTHRELSLTAVEVQCPRGMEAGQGVWVDVARIGDLGLPAAFRAVAQQVGLLSC